MAVGITPKPVQYNAEIGEIEWLSRTLAKFRIRPIGEQVKDFIPGQYVVLGLNNPEGSTLRSYSIASPPNEKRFYEFFIRRVAEENATSTYPLTHMLFRAKPGDGIHLGPKVTGHFTLEHTGGTDRNKLKIFVAAGTGLAPFVSIVLQHAKEILADTELQKNLIVLHGASYERDLGYKEDLARVLNSLEREGYLPTISRPQENPRWHGFTGRVETLLDKENLETLEERLGFEPRTITPDRALVYVCGLKGTIRNTILNLLRRGFVPQDKRLRQTLNIDAGLPSTLFFEQYDTDPILEFRSDSELQQVLEGTPFQK
jgi:ferredoxin--NADP+ reductase